MSEPDRRLRAAVSGLGSSARRLADQPVLALSGRPHCPAGAGDGGAEARCDTRVAGDVYGKRLRAGSKWETAGKRPGAGGNIEGRRRAYLTSDKDFDPTAGGAPTAVQGTWRWPGARQGAVRPRCRDVVCAAGLEDNGFPGRFQFLRMSCNESRGAGESVRARAPSCATPQPKQ